VEVGGESKTHAQQKTPKSQGLLAIDRHHFEHWQKKGKKWWHAQINNTQTFCHIVIIYNLKINIFLPNCININYGIKLEIKF
jgi:hypothetical protein